MAEDSAKAKELKYGALWLAAGAIALVWSTVRAGQGKQVWPGFLDGGGKPPDAKTGAVETVLLWPAAAFKYATGALDAKPAASTSSTQQQGTAQLHRGAPLRVIGPVFSSK